MTADTDSEPRGEPVAYYFRDLLLIGGEATRLYLVRHAQSEGNRGGYGGPDDDPPLSEARRDFDSYSEEEALALRDRIARQPTWDSFPGSEGSAAARRRIVGAMDGVVDECGGKRVAVVVHAAVIQTYVSHVLGLERDFVFYPFNAGITSIRAEGERRVIWRLNDVAHLDGLPPGFEGIS